MKTQERNLLIGGAIAVAVFGLLYLRNKKKKAKAKKNEATTVAKEIKKDSNVLSFGDKGEDVKDIQKYLNITSSSELKRQNLYPLELNGVWDDKLEMASINSSALRRNSVDKNTLKRIKRDLKNANIN
jgi:hypothetical protein